jgi:hypothetical protein
MSDSADTTAELQTLFDSLLLKHGPLSRWTALDSEVATVCARMLLSIRTAPPEDVGKLTATLTTLLGTLPAPLEDADDDFQLSRLSSSELKILGELNAKALNQETQVWKPEDDIGPAPELTAREHVALKLAKYVDERAQGWAFTGPTHTEMIHLRNEVTEIVSPLIAHSLYRDIIGDELRGQYERDLSRALAASGSDVKIVRQIPEERAAISPPPAMLDDGRAPPQAPSNLVANEWPSFTFGNKPNGDDTP